MAGRKRVKLPSATALVARSKGGHVIGRENQLPWHLGSDLRLFRQRTTGHAVIMGRRTYESIGRPLPNRLNIVLSHRPIETTDQLKWANSPSTALLIADAFSIINARREFFLIGGATVYELFGSLINKVFLTEVAADGLTGDAYFDWTFSEDSWWRAPGVRSFPASERDDYAFDVACYIRRVQRLRTQVEEDFVRQYPHLRAFVGPYEDEDAEVAEETQLDLFGDPAPMAGAPDREPEMTEFEARQLDLFA
ncbi:dihydrofolate reductase [Jiella sp. M17.18]|uniref:dihydrofolate reductase n=1 Tax=Jiella sp. M17.18 TaxID=3234247 RepID=UPI0034DE9565